MRRKLTEEEGDKNRKEEREKTLSSTQYDTCLEAAADQDSVSVGTCLYTCVCEHTCVH